MAAPKQGGFKMSLGALKTKPGLKASTAQKDTKKPRLLLGDDEPEDSNKQQDITGWDAAEGGALDANGKKEKEAPRVIPLQPNGNRYAQARRKQLAKAPHQQAQDGTIDEKQMQEPKVQYGLTVFTKDETQENGAAGTDPPEPVEGEKDSLTEEQRLEKKALDALVNGKSLADDLVIPVQTEEEALLYELHNAPDAPTLDAYEATPIEGFGAAMLRGMGWKDGVVAKKPKQIKRRPALLGVGAKEEAAVGIELGEWGGSKGKGKGKGRKVAQSFNPVVLRNKHTGEKITEEELKAKLESQDLVPDQKAPKEKLKIKYDNDSEEEERRREKRREARDYRGDRDRRRDDDYDSERRRDKRRDRERDDDYYDSERRRDKRKDRGRDEYDSARKRDKRRDRSRSPDERRETNRDRYRSRSRDKRTSDRRDRSRF
ncbi:hypothetical protein BDW02DRAFT_568978 [Decorospora gaudefroyi]|uniref:Pre-mRNA-splicing factor n=1 Tax=Decorospora gaudefroyi TaxID=184978 RepID=A0A6A5KGD0_9PLEO|nr:hypothetical protein BDW02DRAFT_568978 [Decorospora gaudefroyi]